MQAARVAGVNGAEKRWQSQTSANGKTIANESKGNEIVRKDNTISNTITSNQSFSSSTPVRPFDYTQGRIRSPQAVRALSDNGKRAVF
jgi:hypothetical protein